jgi:hypothetical protein
MLNTSVKYLARLKYVLDKSQGKLASCRTDGDCVDMLYMDIVSREFYKDFGAPLMIGQEWVLYPKPPLVSYWSTSSLGSMLGGEDLRIHMTVR